MMTMMIMIMMMMIIIIIVVIIITTHLLSSATSEIPTVSIKVTVRSVTWLARIDRAVPNNAAAHPTRPLYNRIYMRSLIVLSHPVLIHLMKNISAVPCVCNSAQCTHSRSYSVIVVTNARIARFCLRC